MTTYYTDANNGNDSNVGSSAFPWLTMPKIGNVRGGNTFNEGDTCYIRNGSYTHFSESSNTDRTLWTKWIADEGNTEVVVASITIDSSFPDGPHDKYYWFEGLTVTPGNDTNGRQIVFSSNHGLLQSLTITGDGFVEGEGNCGVYAVGKDDQNTHHIIIDDCTINATTEAEWAGNWRGIYIINCDDITINNNNISYQGIAIEGGNPAAGLGSHRITVTNNILHDLDSDGMFFSDWEDSTITDNLIYNIDKPIHTVLTGEYTYNDATKTITRVSGDSLATPSIPRLNIVSIVVRENDNPSNDNPSDYEVLPPVDTTKPEIFWKHDWPAIDSKDADEMVLLTGFGADYSDIIEIRIAINFHCDAIQISNNDSVNWKQNNLRIERNTFHDIIDQGLFVHGTTNAHIGSIYFINNLIYNVATDVSVEDCVELYFNNNTLLGEHQSTWQEDTRGAVNFQSDTIVFEFYNNLIDTFGGITSNDITVHNNNIYYSYSFTNITYTPGASEIDLSSLSELKDLCIDYDSKNYRLSSNSQAINHADPIYAPATDILGNPRDNDPSNGVVSAGAYEYIYDDPSDLDPSDVPEPSSSSSSSSSSPTETGWGLILNDGVSDTKKYFFGRKI